MRKHKYNILTLLTSRFRIRQHATASEGGISRGKLTPANNLGDSGEKTCSWVPLIRLS